MQNKKLILTALLILLIPYLLLSFYCHPAADDIEYAASSLYKGYWFSYIRDYHVWNGRYASNLLIFFSPLVWGSVEIYQLIPLLLFILTYTSLVFFISTVTDRKIIGIDLHIISIICLLLYTYNAPSLVEGFYWYTGAVTYQVANACMLFYFALLYKLNEQNYFLNKRIHLFVMCLLVIITCGFNEVAMLIMLAFHLVYFVLQILNKKTNPILFFILAFVIVSALVMITAPGNAGRAAFFPEKHRLFYSLYMTALQIVRFMLNWIIQVPFIVASILFIPLSLRLANVSALFKNNFNIHPAFIVLSLPGIIFLCVFPAYWNMGMLGQHRTLNVAYFFFIPIWFMNLHLAANYISKKGYSYNEANQKRKVIVLFLFCIGLFTNNGYTVTSDLVNGNAMKFNKEMYNRYAVIKAAADLKADEVVVENLSVDPKSLHIYDMGCDPENWINKCYEDYYKVERVRLRTCE